jgi:hypothetical protein
MLSDKEKESQVELVSKITPNGEPNHPMMITRKHFNHQITLNKPSQIIFHNEKHKKSENHTKFFIKSSSQFTYR